MLKKVSDAAEELGLSTDHMRRLIRMGKIPIYRLGPKATRVDVDEIKRLGRVPSVMQLQGSQEEIGAE